MSQYQINAFPIGRTANQLFQIAALIGYCKKYPEFTWGFPSDTREVPHLRKMFPNIPVLDGNFHRYNKADPKDFNYKPIPRFNHDVTLVGFWQSEKFFEGAHDEIRKMFALDIKPIDAVSIHVRRTDYIGNPNTPVVNMFYLTEAWWHVFNRSRTGIRRTIVFSDDIEWCKQNVRWDGIEYCEEKDEFKALSLMASCKHNIIANSTFSWWSAWLNPNPDKIIVSPSVYSWFGPDFGGGPPIDIIPAGWHQIKY